MFNEYIKALLFIFVAEMGDKTQILAMMFATKYKVTKVLIGVFFGALLNHGLAVAFGTFIGGQLPAYMMQMIAGIAFILFAIWTLIENDDEEDEEIDSKKKGNAIITVASAFFIGELGDKTQLTAITLASDAHYPLIILLGTVSGMLVTSAIGIFVGSKLGNKIPDFIIRIVSGLIFLFFGVEKLIEATPKAWINNITVSLFIILMGISISLLVRAIINAKEKGKASAFKKAAANLYEYSNTMRNSAEQICLGKNICGQCMGQSCAIGYIKKLIDDLKQSDSVISTQDIKNHVNYEKNKFDKTMLAHSLAMTINYLNKEKGNPNIKITEIRKTLEVLLFGELLHWDKNTENYLHEIERHNRSIGRIIRMELAHMKNMKN